MPLTDGERSLIGLIGEMLERPDFLLPLVAAETQFRSQFYQLNAAALLEDLFFDALAHFLLQTRPDRTFEAADPGTKEWDYEVEGQRASHKVLYRPDDIAVHWDATVHHDRWSASNCVVVAVGSYRPTVWKLSHGDVEYRARALGSDTRLRPGRALLLGAWQDDHNNFAIIRSAPIELAGQKPRELLPFDKIWRAAAAGVAAGHRVNSLEILVTERQGPPPQEGEKWAVSELGLPAGIYLLPQSNLQNLQVVRNNRGTLIPKREAIDLLTASLDEGAFAALPTWYQAYARNRALDLYISQRAEFDYRFSARDASHREV